MKPIFIFGAGTMAKLAWNCFEHETQYSVSAFIVDDSLHSQEEFCGLPVISSNDFMKKNQPESCLLFIALGYQKLNLIRQSIFERFEKLQYRFISCISSRAMIMNEGNIGKNCFIMEGAVIQPFSHIGDNCIIWSGSIVSHESSIGNSCFLAAHSVVGGMVSVGNNSFLGMNTTVRDKVKIGKSCLIGAGSLVLSDLEDNSFVSVNETPVAKYSAQEALRFIDI